jgi:hypothetical protein
LQQRQNRSLPTKRSESWLPHDRFYSGYSFILNLGYSPKTEYRRVKRLLENKGIPANDQNIKLAMEFVRDIAVQTRLIAPAELMQIQSQVRKQRMVGGILPPDISIAWQLLRHYLEQTAPVIDFGAFLLLLREALKDKIAKSERSPDKITEQESKAVERLITEQSSVKILEEYYDEFTLKFGTKFQITRKKRRVKKTSRDDSA